MYLANFLITHIRSIDHFEFLLVESDYPGWHVLLGDNGAGKSTIARSLALALIGPEEALALRLNFNDWLQHNQSTGTIELHLERDARFDKVRGTGRALRHQLLVPAGVQLRRSSTGVSLDALRFATPATGTKAIRSDRYLWGQTSGWFSAAFGPHRRFAGGNPEHKKFFYSHPRIGRHLSVFGEDVALSESLEWLAELETRKLRDRGKHSLLDDVLAFVNQTGALPHGAQVKDVVSREVIVVDGNGARVSITQLSDGYRSVLSMTLELLRQLTICYGEDPVFSKIREGGNTVELPGVVIIDEIDAHLHPPWQRAIGAWLTKVFPQLQFIVTTHSPLVCQAASRGSVWQLPTPGRQNSGGRVSGVELQRLLNGTVLEQYDTGLFGADVGRSDAARKSLERIAALNRKATLGELTGAEKSELESLRKVLPTGAGALPGSAR